MLKALQMFKGNNQDSEGISNYHLFNKCATSQLGSFWYIHSSSTGVIKDERCNTDDPSLEISSV